MFIFYHIVWLYAFYVTYFTGIEVWSYVRTMIWFLTFSLVRVHIFINTHILNGSDNDIYYNAIGNVPEHGKQNKNTQPHPDVKVPKLQIKQLWPFPSNFSLALNKCLFFLIFFYCCCSSYSYRHQHCPCVLVLQRYLKDKKIEK